ncbi:MAG: hypothetical protein ACR2PL_08390 [Dehalococcoidia bacterium]
MVDHSAPDESLLTDTVRAAIAREMPSRLVAIEPLALSRLMEALGDRRPIDLDPGSPAPAYALTLLQPENELLDLPPGLTGSLVTGDEWEVLRTLRVGETLSVRSRIAEAYERFSGRFGQMLYLRHEWTYVATDAAIVAYGRRTTGYYRWPAQQQEVEPGPDESGSSNSASER